jgi:predicted NACHT family NTPase
VKLFLNNPLARRKFEQPENFVLFEQAEIATWISEDLGLNPTDAADILRAMEQHHGLLIERAQKIWSFSHLTFQEYLIARSVANHPNRANLEHLSGYTTHSRWSEVFLLTTELLPSVDQLLPLMKQQIDGLLAGDEKLQQFLGWVEEKARSVEMPYKPAAVRALYFAIDLTPTRALVPDIDRVHAHARDLGIALDRTFARDIALALALALARSLVSNLASAHTLAVDLAFARNRNRNLACVRSLDCALVLALALACDLARNRSFDGCLALALALQKAECSNPEFLIQLEDLDAQRPKSDQDLEIRKHWWQTCGSAWAADLRAVMIEHRDIGHDWQFTEEQKQRLQQYDQANQLLVECLKQSTVSAAVRQEIEATLLLPLSALNPPPGSPQ